MFGREAFKLINELEASTDIKPFNEFALRQVLTEIDTLYKSNAEEINDFNRETGEIPKSVNIRHEAIARNKRCILAYIYHRMRRLRDMRWQIGTILPDEVTSNLMLPELHWLRTYNRSLATYMKSIGDNGFNITNDLVPPKSLYIEVRCLIDYGKYEFENGQVINLKKNTHHLLPKDECESLIRQGILEHITT